jgi:separase
LLFQNPSKDILTASLDSLFCLAHVKLKCNDPDTYTPALGLERAIVLLDSASGHMNVLSVSAHANYTPVHLWDLADLLYQDSKDGGAVRFLKEACALGARSPHIRVGAMRGDEGGGEQEEG